MMEPSGCYGLKVVVHGPDCKDKQAKYQVNGWDDTYWVDTPDEVLAIIRQDLERDLDAPAKFEMESPLELLGTLKDHVIDSVEIKYAGGQAHVEISGHTGGPAHETLNTKTVSFSIPIEEGS